MTVPAVPSRPAPRRLVRRAAAAALALAAAASAAPASAAVTAPRTAEAGDDVVRLESERDPAATAMVPGVPVAWDVTVGAVAADPGTVTVRLRTRAGDVDAFARTVRRCAVPWTPDGCPGGASTVLPSAPAVGGATDELLTFPVGATAHLRVDVELTRLAPGRSVTFDVVAEARGGERSVSSGRVGAGAGAGAAADGGLATTGTGVRAALLAALASVGAGLGLAGLGRLRRRRAA